MNYAAQFMRDADDQSYNSPFRIFDLTIRNQLNLGGLTHDQTFRFQLLLHCVDAILLCTASLSILLCHWYGTVKQ